jgi:hypothetical protein
MWAETHGLERDDDWASPLSREQKRRREKPADLSYVGACNFFVFYAECSDAGFDITRHLQRCWCRLGDAIVLNDQRQRKLPKGS